MKNKLSLVNILILAATVCNIQTSFAFELSPYFESWGNSTLTKERAKLQITSANLAFGVTSGKCDLEPDLLNKLPDAKRYVNSGNSLRLSFGGQNGIHAEIACKNDVKLMKLLEKVILDSGTKKIDFDIEGHQLSNSEGTARRSRVLRALQIKHPDLNVSFTLPGGLNGLSSESLKLLKTTLKHGVKIDIINIMTMNFGEENIKNMVSPPTMSQASIMSMQACIKQLVIIFPNKSSSQINNMMGITTMIGVNDDNTIFTLEDAKIVANFARENKFSLVSYWSFQRDRKQDVNKMSPINDYSGIIQSNNQFFNIFKSFSSQKLLISEPPLLQSKKR